MRMNLKTALTALTAAIVLSLAVGAASVNRIAQSEQNFKQTFAELTFSESGGGFAVICPVTMEGSFHSKTISKVAEALVGYVKTATVGTCREGRARVLTETLPWHIRYESFSGTLPNITGINLRLVGAAFAIEKGLSVVCLAKTSATNPAKGTINVTGGSVTGLDVNSAATIPTTGAFCPFANGKFAGHSNVTTPTGGSITVTLVQ